MHNLLDDFANCAYILFMDGDSRFVWDEQKRRNNLAKHALDFAEVPKIDFDFAVYDEDVFVYKERRDVLIAPLGEQLVFMAFTERGDAVRVISLRPASNIEIRRWRQEFYA